MKPHLRYQIIIKQIITTLGLIAFGVLDSLAISTQTIRVTAECKVTVLPDPQKITLLEKMLLIYQNSRKLNYQLTPSDAFEDLQWESDNSQVATVSASGEERAIAPGTAKVTVTTHNGKSASMIAEIPEPDFYMQIWLQDGKIHNYHLKDHPNIAYEENRFILKSEVAEVIYNVEEIEKITLSDDLHSEPTGMVCNQESTFSIEYSSGNIVISGCGMGLKTYIYDISGYTIGIIEADEFGVTLIPLSMLHQGINIIKNEKYTYKFIKK